MMMTGSPGLTDYALRRALTALALEKPRQRATSPYAIPALVHGLPNAEAIISRAVRLRAHEPRGNP
jgi:hypothetical protein